jgi:hypothetical protein
MSTTKTNYEYYKQTTSTTNRLRVLQTDYEYYNETTMITKRLRVLQTDYEYYKQTTRDYAYYTGL